MESAPKIVAHGELDHRSGKKIGYTIINGWDVHRSLECDRQWKQAAIELLNFIADQNFDDVKLKEVLSSLSMEDAHWEWFKKAMAFRSEEYEWFFLYAEGKPQGACVIYHPKKSALGDTNIFYVEFIAVAPWNRTNAIHIREFKGVGRALIIAALKFSILHLKLSPGFCLHSLPGAHKFYQELQMVRVQTLDKDTLAYFELPATNATNLMEAA